MVYPLLDGVNNVKGEAADLARLAGDIFTATTGLDATNPISQLTPTAVKPGVEIALNKNLYSGQDLVSEYEKNARPEDMGAKYSTGVARKLAEVTGAPAPWFDNIIGNLGGGLAKDISKGMTDNPDNTKDGRGLLGTLQEGGNRRFASSYVTSQYDIQSDLAKTYKKQLQGMDGFKNLPKEEKTKLLDKVDYDTKAIAGITAKMEQNRGDEIKKDLSGRQKSLVEKGFDANRYMTEVSSTAKGSTSVKVDGKSVSKKSLNPTTKGGRRVARTRKGTGTRKGSIPSGSLISAATITASTNLSRKAANAKVAKRTLPTKSISGRKMIAFKKSKTTAPKVTRRNLA